MARSQALGPGVELAQEVGGASLHALGCYTPRPMAEITNPHDAFFREVFSRPEAARDLVRHYLPPEVVALLDLATLAATKDSFVAQDLRASYSDLLFTVRLKTGRPALVYLLFEHKSHPEPEVAFQLLRYTVRAWEQHRKHTLAGLLPPIIPLVLYHGRTRWQVPTSFRTLVQCPPELEPFVPDFRYLLCDLSAYSDDEIQGEVLARSALLVLKYIFRADLPERLPWLLGLLGDLATKRTGIEYLHTFLQYLVCTADTLDAETLQQALDTALPSVGGTDMPTIAERWMEQGRLQGRQQGRQEGRTEGEAALLVRLVERKFTRLPSKYRTRMEAADAQTLLRWGERILTAQTIEEVFED